MIAFALVVFGLTGCTPKSNYHIRKVEAADFAEYRYISIACAAREEDVMSVDMQIDPQEAINASNALTSAQSSAPVPPGTGPGEAAAGSLVATMIVASHTQRSAYNAAQGKAENLKKALSEHGFAGLLSDTAGRAFAEFGAIPQVDEQAVTPEMRRQLLIAQVEPKIIFDHRLARVRVKADISLADARARNTVYANTFEYWSESVLPDAAEADRENYWSENRAERLKAEVEAGMAVIRAAFERDFAAVMAPGGAPSAYRTLRYEDATGSYFIRGELLGRDDSRFLVRDLRGNIKSIHGKLL